MAVYQIIIQSVFAASHAIRLPDGSLEPLHGHNWPVTVTVEAPELDGIETVMDFHDLQKILDRLIAQVNNRHLNDVAPFAGPDGGLAVNPTAERVAWWFAHEVSRQLPPGVRLVQAAVGEAPGCTAICLPRPASRPATDTR
jgi:6-pyruvoyltetrahydropterin/6-carboxytetrahydropterin synthase